MPLTNTGRGPRENALFADAKVFSDVHERMFGDSFYANVINLLTLAYPRGGIHLVDVGGGTGNFAKRVLKALPSYVTIYEQDGALCKEAKRIFRKEIRVDVQGGDIWDGPMPMGDISTLLNVSGYFTEDQLPRLFQHFSSPAVLANFLVYEDNDKRPIQHPIWKRLGRRGMAINWDIGGDGVFTLHMTHYSTLLAAAATARYILRAEWRYSDFKHERLMWFERV